MIGERRAAADSVTKQLLASAQALDRIPLSLFQLLARISMAATFWSAGVTKVSSWQTTLALFRNEYALPLLPAPAAAVLATGIELICPVLLIVGLGTRLAVLPMLAQILVIEIFVYPEEWIEHLSWAALLLLLLGKGAGTLSLDRALWMRMGPVGRPPIKKTANHSS